MTEITSHCVTDMNKTGQRKARIVLAVLARNPVIAIEQVPHMPLLAKSLTWLKREGMMIYVTNDTIKITKKGAEYLSPREEKSCRTDTL